MAELLNVYNLGQAGVNVDKSPVHLDDNELVLAQNAVQNKQGVAGGLVNRPSLVKYATSVAAGSIIGAISASLGPGPVSTTSDDGLGYYLGINASPYWRKSTNSFLTSSYITTLGQMGTNDVNASAMLGKRLYYIAQTVGDNQSIRVFDGVQDRLFTALPSGYTVVVMAALKGALYLAVTQGGTNSYVYKLDSVGRIRQVGAALPTALTLFTSLGYHNSDLYVAGHIAGATGKVYRIREASAIGTTAWTLDYTATSANQDLWCFCSYGGLMYAGRAGNGGAENGAVLQRSSAGVYSVVDNGGSSAARVYALASFKGALYAFYVRYGASVSHRIRKSVSGSSSWSTVFTAANVADQGGAAFYNTGSKLFAIVRENTTDKAGYWSADGTSWTTFTVATSDFSQHGFGWFR